MGTSTQNMRYFRKILSTILFSLFFISPCFAQSECQEGGLCKVRINLFDGGQNSYDLPHIISANQGTIVKNASISRKGQLSKRKGQELFESDLSNTAWTGLGIFNPDPNTQYIIAASGTKIIRSNTTPASWSIINTGYANFNLTSNKNTEFLQANDLYFVLNGTDNTAAYNGSVWDPGASSTSSPPIATTAVWLRNYAFYAGNPTYPDWVYFSNNLAPRTLTSTDLFKVNTGDGQKIVRLESFKLNELIIYKQKSIYVLDITGATPLTNWTLQPVSTAIGCAALRSVVNFGNDHWFLSNEPFAVRSLLRTSFDKLMVDMVSQPIQDIFDGTGERVINKAVIDKACAVFFDNKYILAIPTGTSTTNNFVVVYDFIAKAWYTIDGWYPAAWTVFNNNLYYIDATDGRVLKCFGSYYSDVASGPRTTTYAETPATPITFEYRSKNIDFDNPENFKQPDALEVEFGSTGNYTASVYIEIDDRGWQSVGTVSLQSTSPTLPADLPIVLSSDGVVKKTFQIQKFNEFKKIKVRVVQNGVEQQCKLRGYALFAKLKPWRRE